MWAHSAFRAIKDSRKRLRWCSAAILDITAAKLLERQLVAAQDVAGLATWNFEVKKNSSETSAGYNALFGVSSASPGPSLNEMLSRVHAEDRATVAFTIRKALSTGTGYTHEYRVLGEQGDVRWLRGLATCLYDGAGEVANLVGATIDITSEKQNRANEIPQPMRDVLEYISDNWNKRLNVEDIAARHEISSRSIFRFFEARGDTFTGYVRRHRLQRARRMLIEAKPGATVTAIALTCGFSNHGHFAKDYHDEFGELPSDTLRK
jgi:AraC-like DNA-binding protein